MSKINSIKKLSRTYYVTHHIVLFRFLCVVYILTIAILCIFIPGQVRNSSVYRFIVYGSFLPLQLLFQLLFYYNIEFPKTLTYHGYRYKRIRASMANRQLTQVHLYDIWIDWFKVFLYTVGIKKIIVIAECKETSDVKVQCPHCKSIMEVEEVQERCPICARSLEDYIYISPYRSW